MKITIIGTGNVGSALGGSFVRAGHHVTLAARDTERTARIAGELGASAATSPAEAVEGADVIVLAVPFNEAETLAGELAGVLAGKVVIDATNPLKADFSGLVHAAGTGNWRQTLRAACNTRSGSCSGR